MKGCRPLTEAEVALVRQSFGGRYGRRDQALFLLGVKSGFRISELLSLQVGDVWRGQRVVERVTVARRHMKRQTEGRTVLLHPEARAALTAWLADLQAAGPCPASHLCVPEPQGRQPADQSAPGLAGPARGLRRQRADRPLGHACHAQNLCQPGVSAPLSTSGCGRGRRSVPADQQGPGPSQPHQHRWLSVVS